jgi:Fe-S cluster assembly protein SufD
VGGTDRRWGNHPVAGVEFGGGQQHNDMHSVITHHQPRGVSRQVHKCVVAQQGQAVFHGTVRVKPAAQGTDAGQINRNLLLSKQAKVDTRPQLAIQADEVQCTHGGNGERFGPGDAVLFAKSGD